jgi:hypothetical protein
VSTAVGWLLVVGLVALAVALLAYQRWVKSRPLPPVQARCAGHYSAFFPFETHQYTTAFDQDAICRWRYEDEA